MDGTNDPFLGGPLELPEANEQKRPSYTTRTNRPHKKKLVYILSSVVVMGGIAFGTHSLLFKKDSSTQTTIAPTPPPTAPAASVDVPAASATKDYNNGPLGVTLTYPDSWTATATSDNGIRVESPDFSVKTVDSGAKDGNFRIYIRKGARAAKDSTIIGRGVAIASSEKVAYTAPAVGQRSDTLLTYFGLDEPTHFNYFFVAGNFNLKRGDTLGPDYGKEPETYIIAGGFSGKDLEQDLQFYSVAESTYKSSAALKQAIDIVKSLKLY